MTTRTHYPQNAPLNETARWLGLDYQWLYRMVRSGEIPAKNLGTGKRAAWWVSPAEVAAYVENLGYSA